VAVANEIFPQRGNPLRIPHDVSPTRSPLLHVNSCLGWTAFQKLKWFKPWVADVPRSKSAPIAPSCPSFLPWVIAGFFALRNVSQATTRVKNPYIPCFCSRNGLCWLSHFSLNFLVSFEGNRASRFNNFLPTKGTLALIPLDANQMAQEQGKRI
jgi:hypothetical protein